METGTRPRPFTFRSSDDPLLRATPSRIAEAIAAHADQKPREKVLLYALVFALSPQRVLEIGVRWGGGSRIIACALRDLGRGVQVGLDPAPALEFPWEDLGEQASLIVGSSPGELARCRDAAGGGFDFVFVDGDHTRAGVSADLRGLLGVTERGANILLHDAYHPPVAQGIDEVLAEGGFVDLGYAASTRNDGVRVETGQTVTYGGVRWLRRA